MNRPLVFFLLLTLLINCQSYKEDSRDQTFSLDENMFNLGSPLVLLKKDIKILEEASGLAISMENKGRFWTHNDSGDGPHIYLFNRDGGVEGTVILEGAEAFDWEDMSTQTTDSANYLYIGDIGDNEAIRDSIIIYRIAEPKFSEESEISISKESVETMVIHYDEGARDAESFFYDPTDETLVLITKREQDVLVYEFEFAVTDQPVTITSKGSIPLRNFTSADVLPSGDILLKNYDNIFYWERNNLTAADALIGGVPLRIPYVKEPQGEAICTDENGNFYTISERSDHAQQQVFFYERKD